MTWVERKFPLNLKKHQSLEVLSEKLLMIEIPQSSLRCVTVLFNTLVMDAHVLYPTCELVGAAVAKSVRSPSFPLPPRSPRVKNFPAKDALADKIEN